MARQVEGESFSSPGASIQMTEGQGGLYILVVYTNHGTRTTKFLRVN
jgi:hypothetical protein